MQPAHLVVCLRKDCCLLRARAIFSQQSQHLKRMRNPPAGYQLASEPLTAKPWPRYCSSLPSSSRQGAAPAQRESLKCPLPKTHGQLQHLFPATANAGQTCMWVCREKRGEIKRGQGSDDFASGSSLWLPAMCFPSLGGLDCLLASKVMQHKLSMQKPEPWKLSTEFTPKRGGKARMQTKWQAACPGADAMPTRFLWRPKLFRAGLFNSPCSWMSLEPCRRLFFLTCPQIGFVTFCDSPTCGKHELGER